MTIINQFYLSPPASGMYWLHQEANNFSITKTAYAAAPTNSFGYSSLAIFQPIWTASRDIAYIILVLIIIMIAFAIMFRVKISPQLVISVQNALPQIVSALILITFSYAIVGFLIDLMYLIFGVLVYGVQQAGGLANTGLNAQGLFNDFLTGNILSKGLFSPQILIPSIILLVIAFFLSLGPGMPFAIFILGLIGSVIVFFFKGFIMLAQTYISLLINLIFGPIIILAEAIPFVKMSALGWFKSVVADILVFTAVGLLFLIQSILMGLFWKNQSTSSWSPPYLGFHPTIMLIVVWIGTWSMIPNIRKMVYEMLEMRAAEFETPREFQGKNRELSSAYEMYNQSTVKGLSTTQQNTINAIKGFLHLP